jgi:hypothetical protein
VPNVNGRLPLSRPFHVRVMLPCYRESLELIQVRCDIWIQELYRAKACTSAAESPQDFCRCCRLCTAHAD